MPIKVNITSQADGFIKVEGFAPPAPSNPAHPERKLYLEVPELAPGTIVKIPQGTYVFNIKADGTCTGMVPGLRIACEARDGDANCTWRLTSDGYK